MPGGSLTRPPVILITTCPLVFVFSHHLSFSYSRSFSSHFSIFLCSSFVLPLLLPLARFARLSAPLWAGLGLWDARMALGASASRLFCRIKETNKQQGRLPSRKRNALPCCTAEADAGRRSGGAAPPTSCPCTSARRRNSSPSRLPLRRAARPLGATRRPNIMQYDEVSLPAGLCMLAYLLERAR